MLPFLFQLAIVLYGLAITGWSDAPALHGVDKGTAGQRAPPLRRDSRPPIQLLSIECLIQGLRLVTPCTQRIDGLIDLLEQIRGGGPQRTGEGG